MTCAITGYDIQDVELRPTEIVMDEDGTSQCRTVYLFEVGFDYVHRVSDHQNILRSSLRPGVS